jgi:hypothetical protein
MPDPVIIDDDGVAQGGLRIDRGQTQALPGLTKAETRSDKTSKFSALIVEGTKATAEPISFESTTVSLFVIQADAAYWIAGTVAADGTLLNSSAAMPKNGKYYDMGKTGKISLIHVFDAKGAHVFRTDGYDITVKLEVG